MIQKLKDDDLEIRASSVDIEEEKERERQEEDLLQRNPDLQGSNERDPRFQIYWLTTTKYVYSIGQLASLVLDMYDRFKFV